MNYLAKMRVLTLLLTLLGNYKSKPEVKLSFMRKKYFLKTIDYVEKYLKKKNCSKKCGILPQTSS